MFGAKTIEDNQMFDLCVEDLDGVKIMHSDIAVLTDPHMSAMCNPALVDEFSKALRTPPPEDVPLPSSESDEMFATTRSRHCQTESQLDDYTEFMTLRQKHYRDLAERRTNEQVDDIKHQHKKKLEEEEALKKKYSNPKTE